MFRVDGGRGTTGLVFEVMREEVSTLLQSQFYPLSLSRFEQEFVMYCDLRAGSRTKTRFCFYH